jgi:arylsulfatase A-like enzyme
MKGFNKLKSWVRTKIPSLTDVLLPFTPIAYNAPYIVNKVISFLSNINKPFFIWAHFMDVHGPYNPPTQNILKFREQDLNLAYKNFLTKELHISSKNFKITSKIIEDLELLYDGGINFVDEFLGTLFRYIDLKFKSNILIIITADHGESFFEHQLFGHQGSVFEELLKVPLIITEMGKKAVVSKINHPVQLLDIAPTILDYFNIQIPEDYQGESLLPLLKGESPQKERIIISECFQNNGLMKRNQREGYILISIRKQDWKYIYNEEENKEYLFDLSQDPAEEVNLIEENQIILKQFRDVRSKHIQNALDSSGEKSRIMRAIKSLNIGDLK